MGKNKIWVYLFCLFTCHAFPQITSTTSVLNVCGDAGVVVTYSSPAGTTASSWTLTSQTNTSNLFSGSFIPAVGNYTVRFSGTVNGSPLSFSTALNVHPRPVANFSITLPPGLCAVRTVTLNDQSTTTSTLVGWLWTYGDGGTSFTSGSHSYGYTVPGSYSVSLKVTDIYGCTGQVTKGTVSVSPTPLAVISSDPSKLSSCNASLKVVFSASNSVGSNLTYSWNFGNSQTSSQLTNTITYNAQANPYYVTLTVTANGCSSVKTEPVTVRPATLNVTTPGTVCLNAAPVATVLSNQALSLWSMGNSNTLYVLTPPSSSPVVSLPSYSVPGTYTITINAASSDCPITPITRTITVEKIIASFTTSPPFSSCQKTFNVSYTNLSSGSATQFVWTYTNHFGQVVTSNTKNPTFPFVFNTSNKYTLDSAGFRPYVTLQATSPSGCTHDTTMQLNAVEPPTAWFVKDKRQGCAPLSVTFHNKSYSFPSFPATSYTWCSNLGTPSFTAGGAAPPILTHTFVYNTPGIYRPYLIIASGACVDTSFIDTVVVANPPAPSFNINPGPICAGQPFQINNTTPSPGEVTQWHVQSNNGFFSACVTNSNPSWAFTQTGLHTFTLSAYKSGCKASVATTQSVQVRGPVVRARYETNCNVNRYSVGFLVALREVNALTVNYGDNTNATVPATGLSTVSLTHVYTAAGDYTVTFSGTNATSGCIASTHTLLVKVRDPNAKFTVPAQICAFVSTVFDASASSDAAAGCNRGYAWYVDDEPPFEVETSTTTYTFTSGGTHTLVLLIKDENSCTDTTRRIFTVSDANSSFSLSSNTICLSGGVLQITNTTPQVPDPIVNYSWNFGDGSTLVTTSPGVPPKSYSSAAVPFTTYTISLTATNSKGCSKTVTHTVQVIRPGVSFTAQPVEFCVAPNTQSNVVFQSLKAYPSYTYNFGVSATSTLASSSATVSYPFPAGVFNVSLSVQDAGGCVGTGTLQINARAVPVADFLVSTPGSTAVTNVICLPGTALFQNISEPKPNIATWDIGAGTILQKDIIAYTYPYTTTTVVPVSLTVTSGAPLFCTASVTKNFTLYTTKAEIAMNRTLVCVGQEINFSIDTLPGSGVRHWIWDFADFSPSDTLTAGSAPPFIAHKYSNFNPLAAGDLTVSMVFWNQGKTCGYTKQRPIRVIRVKADFLRNREVARADSIHCLNIPDRFSNRSTTNDGAPLSFSWKFPDGRGVADSSVTHTFPTAGVHQVSLTAINPVQSCSHTAVKNITIAPAPVATVVPDDYCPGVPFTLTVNTSPGVVSGTWSPAERILGSPEFTMTGSTHFHGAIADASTQFSLQLTDENSCRSDTIVSAINILQPPLPETWDTSVVIGEPVPINADKGKYNYTWQVPHPALSCSACPRPVSTTTVSTIYTVRVEDHKGCAYVMNTYRIEIMPKSSLDLPTAFTPNGDGVNDVIYVGGWGIRNLIHYRIFNRWGQLLFETNDVSVGWDGTFRGVQQPVDTYIYQVSAETYIDAEPITKSSTFKLLR